MLKLFQIHVISAGIFFPLHVNSMRMFCLIFNFQVNYEKLLWCLKIAASDDPQQNKRVEDSKVKEAQGGRHQRYFSPFLWA